MSKLKLTIDKKTGKARVRQTGKSGVYRVTKGPDGKPRVEKDHGATLARLDVSTRLKVLNSKKVRVKRGAR